jgi:hypothetical protein
MLPHDSLAETLLAGVVLTLALAVVAHVLASLGL